MSASDEYLELLDIEQQRKDDEVARILGTERGFHFSAAVKEFREKRIYAPRDEFSKKRLAKARSLIEKHGLKDWRCEVKSLGQVHRFDNRGVIPGSRIWGECDCHGKTIYLDSQHVRRGTWRELRNTIIHEIAHALTPLDMIHGVRWQRKARGLGVFESSIRGTARWQRYWLRRKRYRSTRGTR